MLLRSGTWILSFTNKAIGQRVLNLVIRYRRLNTLFKKCDKKSSQITVKNETVGVETDSFDCFIILSLVIHDCLIGKSQIILFIIFCFIYSLSFIERYNLVFAPWYLSYKYFFLNPYSIFGIHCFHILKLSFYFKHVSFWTYLKFVIHSVLGIVSFDCRSF